jgi:uncharacterized protein (TIGR03437 family)
VISTTPFAANSPTSFTVTLHVNAGTISSSPVGLTFTQVQGGPAPPAQSLGVAGAPSSIAYSASATPGTAGMSLSVTPSTGSTPGTVQVTADAGSLQAGTYKGTVTISANDADGSPLPVPVTLNVLPSRPLSVSATVVSFTAAVGATSQQTQKVVLASAGGTVAYTVTLFGGGPWLNVSPLSGTTPDSLVITVDPTGLGTGLYSATLTATSPNSVPAPVITVSLAVGSVTKPVLNAVANAANYLTGAVAPGENVVLFGSGMGPDILKKGTVTAGVVDTTVSGTRILFDGIPAPLIYVSALQSSAMVPYGVAGRSITNVVVEYLGVQSAAVAYNVTSASPGMYTQNAQGNGPGGIINADYSINLAGSPAPRGSYVAVYMTGEGFTSGAVDGALATALLSPVLPVTATVGGIPATVYYAGTAPGIVTGVMQVDVLIPLNVTPGPAVPIVVTVGSPPGAFSTQAGVTVAVK